MSQVHLRGCAGICDSIKCPCWVLVDLSRKGQVFIRQPRWFLDLMHERNWILGESSNKLILQAASHFTSRKAKKPNQPNKWKTKKKKPSKTSQNNFEPICGKKGSWEKGKRERETANTKPHLQIILNTVHKLCRRHSLDITIPETCFVSPPLISHLREVLFILVTQKITQHSTCQKQTILFSAGLGGVLASLPGSEYPSWSLWFTISF